LFGYNRDYAAYILVLIVEFVIVLMLIQEKVAEQKGFEFVNYDNLGDAK